MCFKIGNTKIGHDYEPYIIAEMSANHNGSVENAKKIISLAKECGASAVKIQTYRPDTITLDSSSEEFRISDGLWAGRTLYELYEEAHMPWEWHSILFDYAKSIDITLFSSPFDKTAVDLLENLQTPAYKIASFEAIDLPLISYAAQTKKPLIISTGMANKLEIEEAVDVALSSGSAGVALLLCVSGYPAPALDYNLKTLTDMYERFNVTVGLSDHTIENTTAIASVALGASIIEKHFTLDRNGGGPDDSFSLEPKDLKELVVQSRTAWQALGKVEYGLKSSEIGSVKFRRSLYFVRSLNVGDVITERDIKSVRPGYGLEPKLFDKIIGKKVLKSVEKNTPVTFESVSV